MILNEDTALAYANGIQRVFERDFGDNDDIFAFGVDFNKDRLKKETVSIFNYTVEDFVAEVLKVVERRMDATRFKKYKSAIKRIATDYAEEKIKISKRTHASVNSYFNY